MNDKQKREIVAVLIKAKRKDLALALTRAEVSDLAWDKIAGAWVKAQGAFYKTLKANEKDVLSYPFMQKAYKKSLDEIYAALKQVSDVIRRATEEV